MDRGQTHRHGALVLVWRMGQNGHSSSRLEAAGEGTPGPGRNDEPDPRSVLHPLHTVGALPAHRVGGVRRIWHARTARLDPTARCALELSGGVLVAGPHRHHTEGSL